MPGVEEFSGNPLMFIDSQFEKHLSDGRTAESFLESITKLLSEKTADEGLSQTQMGQLCLKGNSLVKITAMVQDMSSPEYFALKYEAEDTFKPGCFRPMTGVFRDELPGMPEELKSFIPAERISLHCVEVPGETDWVRKKVSEKVQNIPVTSMETDESSAESDVKKFKTEGIGAASMSHRIPIPERSSLSCFIKIYTKLDEVKLNEVVEFAGIVDLAENSIPVVHAFHYNKQNHINPLMNEMICIPSAFPSIRDQLLKHITSAVANDHLAAEYLLCNLISSIYFRKNVIPLGKFTLNFTNVPTIQADWGRNLFTFLSQLVTKAHFLPLSLASLNCAEFVPKKNYDTDELHSGQLQLSPDTHLLVDETALSAGQLNEKGLKNLAALRTLVLWQKLDYDFQFHTCEFSTDFPVLIVSEGKSILNADYIVPIVPSESMEKLNVDEAKMNEFRSYITRTKAFEYSIGDSMQKVVEDTFVSMRQANSSVSTDDLNNLLVLARLLSISHGLNQLTEETWARAVMLENLRKSRLNNTCRNTAAC